MNKFILSSPNGKNLFYISYLSFIIRIKNLFNIREKRDYVKIVGSKIVDGPFTIKSPGGKLSTRETDFCDPTEKKIKNSPGYRPPA